jgi:hypothetical protein
VAPDHPGAIGDAGQGAAERPAEPHPLGLALGGRRADALPDDLALPLPTAASTFATRRPGDVQVSTPRSSATGCQPCRRARSMSAAAPETEREAQVG